MATPTKASPHTAVTALQQEVRQLRSFVIGLAGKDPEGAYRPEFVREILRAAKEKPRYQFWDARSFLRQLRNGRRA